MGTAHDREATLQRRRQNDRIRYQRNKERIEADRKARNAKNPHSVKERNRLYYLRNIERRRAYDRSRDRKKISDRAKRRRLLHPDAVRIVSAAARRKHDAKVRGSSVGDVPSFWIAALKADPCSYCGGVGGTTDHVHALSRGGSHIERNLAGACQRCNSSKHTKPLLSWLLSNAEKVQRNAAQSYRLFSSTDARGPDARHPGDE